MKNVRNLPILLLAFLTVSFVGFFACQKSQAIEPSNSPKYAVLAPLSCPAPTIISGNPSSSSPLYDYRVRVAMYRFYKKTYTWYRNEKNAGRNPVISDAVLNLLGLSESIPIGSATIDDLCKKHYNNFQVPFDMVSQYVNKMSLLTTVQKNAIVARASTSAWSNGGNFGSYTIIFKNTWNYSGKTINGAQRASDSAGENCPGTTKFNTCYFSGVDQPGDIADFQSAMLLSGDAGERTAFKEEAIRLINVAFEPYRTCPPVGQRNRSSYNENNSAGIGYINTDGI